DEEDAHTQPEKKAVTEITALRIGRSHHHGCPFFPSAPARLDNVAAIAPAKPVQKPCKTCARP
ncbi:MAG: hypothetical protein AAF205_10720, partial [Pseudomonadota bacterium]